MQTWLHCTRCGRETPHVVRYSGRVLRSASCVTCGLETHLHRRTIGPYLIEVRARIASKPERIARELRARPKSLLTLPRRIVSKPSREAVMRRRWR